MHMNQKDTNHPNDYKVVSVENSTDFDFTPELGCMFDGRPLELPAGETRQYPYHIGRRIALNLAKQFFLKKSSKDTPEELKAGAGNPLWTSDSLSTKASEFMKELYSDEVPIRLSEHEQLMKRVEELEAFKKEGEKKTIEELRVDEKEEAPTGEYKTKADVIKALDEKEIKYDAKKTKADLEKLLEE